MDFVVDVYFERVYQLDVGFDPLLVISFGVLLVGLKEAELLLKTQQFVLERGVVSLSRSEVGGFLP